MTKLSKEELIKITGGSDLLTATFINALTKCLNSIFEIGRAIGSSIARLTSGNICS